MAFVLIFFGAALRVATHFHDSVPLFQYLPNTPNFAPIAAIALFGGVYLNKKYAIVIPAVAMLLADYFIGFYNPYVMISVYGSFLIIGILGIWLKSHKSVGNILGASLLGSSLFFIITNFAVWMAPQFYYPRTLPGLVECYTLALPFFRNSILGDVSYVIIFFGAYELVRLYINQKEKECLKKI
jgi:hypothetical protein